MKDTVVIDMDGTLANVDHRRHWVQGKKRNYEAFHAELSNDPVNEAIASLMEGMGRVDMEIVIVSARPESLFEPTVAWLAKNEIHYDSLRLLRPDGDSTPDQELKRAWLYRYGKDRILFVVDDRSKVVKMWRDEGLTCLQCDSWEER